MRIFSGRRRGRHTFPSPLVHLIVLSLFTLMFTHDVLVVDAMNQPPPTSSKATQTSSAENIVKQEPEAHQTKFAHFSEEIEDFIEHYSAFAGRIFPMLSKFVISKQTAKQILSGIQTVARWDEWVMIILIGWATVPLVKYPYEYLLTRNSSNTGSGSSKSSNDPTSIGITKRGQDDDTPLQFEDTFISQLAKHISQAGKIAALVYGIDFAIIAFQEMGFAVKKEHTRVIPQVIYTLWMFFRLMMWKRFVLTQAVFAKNRGRLQGKRNRAQIANKITDLIMVAIGAFFLIDLLQINTGITLKSFFAVGGAGTVLVSFASKDLAMAVVSGLALQASDKMFEGDLVKVKDIIGKVDHIGLMETVITDTQEMKLTIPNKELFSSRLINMSRIKYSRVLQELHFHYEDAHILPQILDEIIKEIRTSCSMVVKDGSKPLRANLQKFGLSELVVEFEAVLNCSPGTLQFQNGRQEVLLAIDRAVRRLGKQLKIK